MKSIEIAKLAGVSRSTVSRVINNYGNVPPETYKKVMDVIEQYHYEPNVSARVLAGMGTNTIGFFIISVSDQENPKRIYQNNYYAPFLDAVVDRANALDYYVLVQTVYSVNDYAKIMQTFLQKRIDAGIIIGIEKDNEIIKELMHLKYPIAIIDYDVTSINVNDDNAKKLSVINGTDYDGTVKAIRYLIENGHKEIGIIKGRTTTFSGRQRYKAYIDTMNQYGIPIKKQYVLSGDFLKNTACQEVRKLIQQSSLPTAMFISNDEMALGVLEVLKEEGIKVPEDISIIGFDDVPLAAQIRPALSTVRIPVYDMAVKAVDQVIAASKDGPKEFSAHYIPTELIIRETCSKRA